MPQRPAVETWNRGELEDRFYRQYDQLIAVKQQNHTLEKKLKMSSGRIRQALDSNGNTEAEDRCQELERENRLLAQKMKAMKQQLIAYTRPQAHNTTLTFLTSRSTARTRPSGTSMNEDAGGGGVVVPPLANTGHAGDQRLDEPSTSGLDAHTAPRNEPHPPPRHSILVDPARNKEEVNTEEKLQIIRLHREMHEKMDEINDLHLQLEKNESKLHNIRDEYDRLVFELESTKQRLHVVEQEKLKLASQPGAPNLPEKEFSILREENKVLKAANERLVANSLAADSDGKSSELLELQKHIQETELRLTELQNENKHISRKLKESEMEKKSVSSKYKKVREKYESMKVRLRTIPEQSGSKTDLRSEASASPVAESPVPTKILKREKQIRAHVQSSILDRLFDDVANIVDSHFTRSDSSHSLDNEPVTNGKWRQLYESVYSELEKIRNLLMIQHRINERQKKEISLLNDYNDHNKQEYERKLADFVLELNRRANRIQILEGQLRSIANGATDFDRSLLSEVESGSKSLIEFETVSTTEMALRLKKLTISADGVKRCGSGDPITFLSLEFFDFELQTTPLIQGAEAVFDYSTVYDVIVSNLFVHYIQSEGISIEFFKVQGVAYEQLATGIISLKKLLDTDTPARLSGQLKLTTKDGATILGTLEYQIDIPFNLVKALKAQRRRLTAISYLPISEADQENQHMYNHLIVQIHRCTAIQALLPKQKTLPSTYVVYQLYDLQPHLTAVQKANGNPVFNDSREFTLPLGAALHGYLKTSELQIFVLNESKEKFGARTVLGSVNLPLFPLARNQRLQGTFPLSDPEGNVTEANIDVSLHWKFAYTFNDEQLEIEMPAAVAFPKPSKPPAKPLEKPSSPPSLSKGMSPPLPPKAEEPTVQPSSPESPLLAKKDSFGSSLSSADANTVIEMESPKAMTEIDVDLDLQPTTRTIPSAPSPSTSDSSHTYVVDDDDFMDEELQQKVRETSIDSVSEFELPKRAPLPPNQPNPEASPSPPGERRFPELVHLPTETSSTDFSSSTDTEIEGLREELEKFDKNIRHKLPPIPPPRRGTLRFTEPLHSSIPPSEESSLAGSVNTTPRPRDKAHRKSTPDVAATAASPAIRPMPMAPTTSTAPEHPQSECTVTIRLGRLSILKDSMLLDEMYNNVNVFIEWNFLDFDPNLCETHESVPIPRNSWTIATFECERVYELSERRTALLRQWIETSSRLSFNLVSDPEDGDQCDDLGVAQLGLHNAIHSSVHEVTFFDVNNMELAELELTVVYSDELTKLLVE